jgi:hypothetical protein
VGVISVFFYLVPQDPFYYLAHLANPPTLDLLPLEEVYVLLPRFPQKNLIEDKKEGPLAFQFPGRQTDEHVAVWRFIEFRTSRKSKV